MAMLRIIIAVLLATVSLVALGQSSTQKGLAGINNVGILVDGLDADATACGLSEEALQTSLRFVLQQSRIRVVDNSRSDGTYLYVNVATLDNCAVSVYL